MRQILLLLTAAFLAAWAPPASAQETLERAIELWLEGRDRKSLSLLSELARGGDSDARLLLARIETKDLGPSPYRLSLSRDEKRALFRDVTGPGFFGRTWISVEAERGNIRARALADVKQPVPNPELIAQLHELGEFQATDWPARIVALYGTEAMQEELRTSGHLLPELKPYLDYLTGTPEPRGDGLAALRLIAPKSAKVITADDPDALGMAGLLSLGYGFGDLDPANRWRPAVENWLLSSEATRPVATLCNADCPAEAGACAMAFLALSGGYFEVIRFDSPLEKVIPQEQFTASPRARLMLLNRAALTRSETNLGVLASHAEIAEISQCAADLIRDTREKYENVGEKSELD